MVGKDFFTLIEISEFSIKSNGYKERMLKILTAGKTQVSQRANT
jgi:hypothetical protein